MTRLALPTLAVALCAAFLAPTAALGKGPIEATIEGPGLESPLQFGDWENWGEENALASSQPIMQLAEAAGFFRASFGHPALPTERPAGALGPRYVIEYAVPGPNGAKYRIEQELYPYAKPNPLTYMAPGQPFFATQTRGGWYVATNPAVAPLLVLLVEAGLPRTPPTASDDLRFPWAVVGVVVTGGILAAGALVARRLRRPATA